MSLFKQTVPRNIPKTDLIYVDNQIVFDRCVDSLMQMPYWVFDTETTGLDQHKDKVILIQIGNQKYQYVINPKNVDITKLRGRLEDDSFKKWGHNIGFDYRMMKGTFGFTMEGLRDTMLAERVLTAGIQNYGFSLVDVARKYLKMDVDKEMQTSFIGHTGEFTREQLVYAALDCVYPDLLLTKMLAALKEHDLMPTFLLECDAIPAFGDMDFYGLLLDRNAWQENIRIEQDHMDVAYKMFMVEVAPHVEKDLFGNPDINPGSTPQVLALFEKLFKEPLLNEKGKKSVDKKVLESLQEKYPESKIVSSLMRLRKHQKKCSTYGDTYIRAIHPDTGRLHPKISQLAADTGRPTGRKPNMLNIPKEQRYRTPFIAGLGRKIVGADYNGCELRIMASESKDPVMCKGFNEGLDYHAYTASEFITNSDGTSIVYSKVVKWMRSLAKTINFGLAYGMGVAKLAASLGVSIEVARGYFNSFKEKFRDLISWLDSLKELALVPRARSYYSNTKDLGFSTTKLGRKRFYKIPSKPHILNTYFESVGQRYDDDGVFIGSIWRGGNKTLNYNPHDPWDKELPEPLKLYYGTLAGIKRAGANSPIQGGNADITKLAMISLRKFIRGYEKENNGGKYVAHIALQIYDEILIDCPENLAPLFSEKIKELMEEAGRLVITEVPVIVDVTVGDHWIKD